MIFPSLMAALLFSASASAVDFLHDPIPGFTYHNMRFDEQSPGLQCAKFPAAVMAPGSRQVLLYNKLKNGLRYTWIVSYEPAEQERIFQGTFMPKRIEGNVGVFAYERDHYSGLPPDRPSQLAEGTEFRVTCEVTNAENPAIKGRLCDYEELNAIKDRKCNGDWDE